MSGEELLESLDRHFMAGCPSLSTSQLRQHQASGSCPECRKRAAEVSSESRPVLRDMQGEQ